MVNLRRKQKQHTEAEKEYLLSKVYNNNESFFF